MSTYELQEIELLEVSGVDTPANQHAAVVLTKRSGYKADVKSEMTDKMDRGDGSVTVEELTQKLEALQTQVTDLTAKAEDYMAREERMMKSAEAAGFDVKDGEIVKRAEPEYVEIEGEKVEKGLVPAPVLRMIEKQAVEMAELKKQAEEVELAKRGATELPNLTGTDLTKGRLLAAVEGDEELLKTLKAADAAMSSEYVEKGHGNTEDFSSPAHKLDQLAKAHAAAQSVSFEMAYAEVTKSGIGADLLVQMRNTAN